MGVHRNEKFFFNFSYFFSTHESFLYKYLRLYEHRINKNIAHTFLHCSETAILIMST